MRLQRADLFYVTANMVELAAAAAQTIPPFELQPADVPTPAGLMVFAEPPVEIPAIGSDVATFGIAAVCWGPHPARADEGLVVTTYLNRAEAGPPIDRAAPRRRVIQGPRLIYAFGYDMFWNYGRHDDADRPEGIEDHPVSILTPFLRSAWLLMQQGSVSATCDVDAPRAARRRMQRAGHDPSRVRLIELRRLARSETAETSGHEYRHQWIVRGHWRQQWYPSRDVHRPVWIAPHVKGPEHAPLLGGEKVHVWKR